MLPPVRDHIHLQKPSDKINPYGSNSLKPVGKFTARLCKGNAILEFFYFTLAKSGCLLSLGASLKLGLIKITTHVLNSIGIHVSVAEQFIEKHPELHTGIGKMRNYKACLSIDEDVPPVAVNPHPNLSTCATYWKKRYVVWKSLIC